MSSRGWLYVTAAVLVAVALFIGSSRSLSPFRLGRPSGVRSTTPGPQTPQDYFNRDDKDKDGKISHGEWTKGYINKKAVKRRELMFTAADKDRDGYWTLEEWENRVHALNEAEKAPAR